MPSSQTHNETLQLIAEILSFKNSDEELKHKLETVNIDWDQFVTIASDHLVLTTSYCKLKERKFLTCLPPELSIYLEELTAINRNRNHKLIDEAKGLAELFETNNINYVFLKGTAMLIAEYYDDLGERMVGDIDMLIDERQIHKAFDILLTSGYTKMPSSLRATFFEHKHLDRLVSNNSMCAVELHKYVLNKPVGNILETTAILETKKFHGKSAIPNINHLFIHNILNFQVNDKGHYYSNISLRSA